MTYAAFILLFWPLIAAEVLCIVVLPIAIVILLVQLERRRLVKRMHQMRKVQKDYDPIGPATRDAIASLKKAMQQGQSTGDSPHELDGMDT